MNIDKKTEAEVFDVYERWLHSYLNGDVETYDSYFDNSFHFIGSTKNEEFLNRRDTTQFFAKTGDQLAGKTELRNETKIVEQFGELIFLTHFFDAWFRSETDWSFYGRFRCSNALRKNEDGWRFVYQHYSVPDSKAQEGETIGFDQISKENLQLREAIQRRTKELEEKNRELEVESALDRIRAEAVAMKESSDLLDIVVTMRQEFVKLGHEAHYFWHMMWLPETYEKAMTSGDGTKVGFVMKLPRKIHLEIPHIADWEKSDAPILIHPMDVEAAIDYVDKMISWGDFTSIDPQAPTHDDIKHIGGLTFIMARTSHGEIGYSLPGVVENPPQEDLAILEKFAGAFDLAHRRFLDLQKAEKQAREVQIELALEKVRSRSMAMQSSEELTDAGALLYQELSELGIQHLSTGYTLFDENAIMGWSYGVNPIDGSIRHKPVGMDHTKNKVMKTIAASWKKQEPLSVIQLNEQETVQHQTFIAEECIGFPLSAEKLLSISPERLVIHTFNFKLGYLLIVGGIELTVEQQEMTTRFANVFEQTYTRFLDLEKAEAQARESKIEAALERVRSRSMAMHNSDEIGDVAFELFEQLKSLGGELWGTGFGFCEKDSNVDEFWFANENGIMPHLKIPNNVDEAHKKMYQGWEKNLELFSIEKSGKELKDHYNYMLTVPDVQPIFQGMLDNGISFPKWQKWYAAYFKYGYLLVITTETYDDEGVFKRFAKVFEQAYTRFLDLKKAEAQAREAQIQLALERVRAKTMAMQHSDELVETSELLFQQIKDLGIELWSCGYSLWFDDDSYFIGYNPMPNGKMGPPLKIPLTEDVFFKTIRKAKRKGDEFLVFESKGKSLVRTYQYMDTLPVVGEAMRGIVDAGFELPKYQVTHCGFFTHGHLMFITHRQYPEEHDIFKRFTKEFEQAYTRFLDLQKAEAQAREAQIEVAVERVRAEAMAMHTTSDFEKVTHQLLHQMKNLELDGFTGTSILLIGKDDNFTWWDFSSPGNISDPKSQLIQYNAHDFNLMGKEVLAKWKEGDNYMVFEYDLERLKMAVQEWQQINPQLAEAFEKAIADGKLTYQWNPSGRMFNGLLAFDMVEPPNEDVKLITIKMTHAFEQAYIRFLDLKKAEAQAREAQIETALERVRSQSMGMQTSEDLSNVTTEMFNQLRQLGGDLFATGIVFCDKHEGHVEQWHSLPEAGMMSPFIVPIDLDYIHQYRYDEWKKGTDLFSVEIPSDFIKQHFRDIFNLPSAQKVLKDFEDQNTPMPEAPPWEIDYGASFKNGYLLVSSLQPFEEASILPRFAKVFEQAYTRFLDLQKAEAQAREAQIEAALERVRAKAMSMQDSNELDEVLSVLCEQFDVLGILPMSTHMTVFDLENNTFTFRETGKYGDRSFGEQTVALDAMDNWKETVETWKANKATSINKLHFPKEQLPEVWKVFHQSFASMPEGSRITPNDYPEGIFHTAGKHPFGYIGMNQVRPATEEEEQIVIKFANEFGRAYQRFLDLQKAEAQAHEAQIEAALEKVRSRSLAMRHASELEEVVVVIVEKLTELGVIMDANGITLCTYFNNSKDVMHWIASPDFSHVGKYLLPYFDHVIFKDAWKSKEKGDPYFSKAYSIEEKNSFFEHAFEHSDYKNFPEEIKQWIFQNDQHILSFAWQKNSAILIPSNTGILPTDDEQKILIRFSKVFEQAYIRFLDLQKAEAQAREAQIEAALERVRSRSMAMHKSDELKEVIQVLYDQFVQLGIPIEHAGFILDYKENDDMHIWLADQNAVFPQITLPYFDCAHWNSFIEAKKKERDFFTNTLDFKEKNKFYKDLFEFIPDLPEDTKNTYFEFDGLAISTVLLDTVGLYIENYKGTPFSDEENDILMRFGKVFQQSYTRFQDLQKAEAQARESEIELGLERLRAKAMAMQNSDELSDLVATLLNELTKLDFSLTFCIINIYNEADQSNTVWAANPEEGKAPESYYMKFEDYPFHHAMMREWKAQTPKFVYTMEGEEKAIYDEYLFTETEFRRFPKEVQDANRALDKYVASFVFSPFGGLQTVGDAPLSVESLDILYRFGKVFDQTYTRFLDLQKAEAQTREAQINLAVERVRATALAMHKSQEIMGVVAKLKDEVMALDIPNVIAATIFLKEGTDQVRMWDLSSLEEDNNGYEIPFDITFKLKKKDPHLYIKRVWENQENYFIEKQESKDFERIIAWLRENGKHDVAQEVEEFIAKTELKCLYHAVKKLTNGKLAIDLLQPPSEEMETILTKMGAAFDLAYKRFEDLQKAERQAREAKIEAAMEKVRSRTMAMQDSKELPEAANVLFLEVQKLGIPAWSCGYNILSDDKTSSTCIMSSEGELQDPFVLPLTEHESLLPWHNAILQNKDLFVYGQRGKDLTEHYEYMKSLPDLRDTFRQIEKAGLELPTQQYNHLVRFNEGFLLFITYEAVPNDHDIFIRFGKVFEQTYTRFLDLERAEAQTREVKIETALEKVRNVALGLKKSDDLLAIAEALYVQLAELGFDDIRNVIIDVNNEDEKTFMDYDYSHEMGGTVTRMSYDDDPTLEEQLRVISNTTDGYSEMVLKGQQLQDLIDMRRNNGEADDPRLSNTDSVSYILYAFGNGAIGISNFGKLSEQQKTILSRFRNVFTFAYQRYTDLAQAEAQSKALLEEKERLEKTLTDLQATQKQLIQSEKMASLGELTAGIAHEIQNPLNFVNNFSEVSNELIDEIEEELQQGDLEEVQAILKDIKQNLEKINHHGKRADGIVKGMLQHSRASKAEKEPTNINQLADEYLRLAYHGLRAKDKSFNATLETNFDERIGEVAIIPQDMGRVILNLLTNAFYATNEKKKLLEATPGDAREPFKPTVTMSTRKENDQLFISVQDNGNGIPKHVIDKIFQPFFTTKPTGQGTGLGLSMSYDIVTKGHNGKLHVETNAGKGTTFLITIPIKK